MISGEIEIKIGILLMVEVKFGKISKSNRILTCSHKNCCTNEIPSKYDLNIIVVKKNIL